MKLQEIMLGTAKMLDTKVLAKVEGQWCYTKRRVQVACGELKKRISIKSRYSQNLLMQIKDNGLIMKILHSCIYQPSWKNIFHKSEMFVHERAF